MGLGSSRFPDPYQSRGDLSHATVFFIVLMLIIAIGSILFFGSTWVFAPIAVPASLNMSAVGASRMPVAPTPGSAPTFTAPTPVPPLAGVPYHPQPSVTAVGTASNAPAAPPPTPSPGTPTPQATAVIANTGGDGVYLRHTPHLADRWIAWPDNTRLVLLGNEADGDGQHWFQVRDPKGDVAWVPAQFVRR
jgi:hypothetical protein